ncbi:phosphatidylcholine and lysophosphatidylcholine phospholipase, partial [Kappamyces sp. JEL0680]
MPNHEPDQDKGPPIEPVEQASSESHSQPSSNEMVLEPGFDGSSIPIGMIWEDAKGKHHPSREKRAGKEVSHWEESTSPWSQMVATTAAAASSAAVAVSTSAPTITAIPGVTLTTSTTALSMTTTWVLSIFQVLFGYVPMTIYKLLSSTLSLTVTLDFWGILSLIVVIVLIALMQRLGESHQKLPPPQPAVPKNQFDLKPDSTLDDATRPPGYPDEFMNAFLSSIKVFGYLDRPVFHELAKNLQTKKLKAGEILFQGNQPAEADWDFYIVVDGKMQVFIKTNEEDREDEFQSNHMPGHHLLNEVRSGGTVSSLFSILSILTEDLDLPLPLSAASSPTESLGSEATTTAEVGKLSINTVATPIPTSVSSSESSLLGDMTPSAEQTYSFNSPIRIDPKEIHDSMDRLDLVEEPEAAGDLAEDSNVPAEKLKSVHPNLVARAASSVTLAVIPASSFRNLSAKFPKAASQMVSVILTRFQRVTFLTLQRYLGLSKELLEIERKVNEIAGSGLSGELFPNEMVESCAWRLSHQYSEDPADFYSPFHRVATPKRQHSGTDPFQSSRAIPPLDELHEHHTRFLTGDVDERLRDGVFTCIAQLIGLTPSKEAVSTSHDSSANSSQIGSSIERFYYSRKTPSHSSVSTGSKRGSLFYEDDLIS